MALSTSVSNGLRVHGQIKLARLLALSERDFEKQIKEMEVTESFQMLRDAGVVSIRPYERATFAARHFASRGLSSSAQEFTRLLDGHGNLARVIERIGQERFEEVFLRDTPLSDQERAATCCITVEESKKVREMVDELYVQAELEGNRCCSEPALVYSNVAGIEIQRGRPVIAFFHREIWKGRYAIDRGKWSQIAGTLPSALAREMGRLLSKLEFAERRKTTLYKTLEEIIDAQADYLATGDVSRRAPLTQKRIAMLVGISRGAFNHLISNKSVQLPWGLEVPLRALMPSAKSILLDRLYDVAMNHPDMSDIELCLELRRAVGVRLSRRSIAQYRNDLGVGGRGRRSSVAAQ